MEEVEERLPEWPALLMVRLLCLGNLGGRMEKDISWKP